MKKEEYKNCIICNKKLKKSNVFFYVTDLFKLWSPIVFSDKVIKEHSNQSNYTEMYFCPKCKFEIFYPQILGTPDFYNDLQSNPDVPYYVDDKWEFGESLKDVKKNDLLIEIGCGPGAFLEKAQKFCSNIYGSEYNIKALNLAKSKGFKIFGLDDEVADIKGSFDFLFTFQVLEHVNDPVNFMKDLMSWIKPGGKIGISVPDQNGPVKFINPCVANMPPHHLTHWKLKTFKMLARKLGLKIDRYAFEPLTRENFYYYTIYGIDYYFSNKFFITAIINKFLKKNLSNIFNWYFNFLNKYNKKCSKILKGQSIYILFSKPKESKK